MLSPGGFGLRQPEGPRFGPEVPCARCEKRVRGIQLGELCPDCLRERRRRAASVARTAALVVTVVVGLWGRSQMGPNGSGRTVLIIGVVATYFLVRKIVMQIAMEYLRR